jgi:cytochrome c-type biogenesis protein CcmH
MKGNSLYRLSIFLILALVVFMPINISAQDDLPTDDEVNAIAKQLFCPVCENIPLDTCGTAACEQWRGIIRDKLAEGWSEEEIKTYFVNQYGDRVLAEPPARGFNWVIYIVPLVIFITGGYLFVSGFRKWQAETSSPSGRQRAKKPPKVKKASDEYLSKVEEELKKRSGE